jgi:3-dehydroquinate synthase
MKSKIHINLKRVVDNSYDLVIGTSLKEAAGEILRLYPNRRKFVITDSHVKKLYGGKFLGALRRTGEEAHLLAVPAGERSKNRNTKGDLEDRLLKVRAGRDSLIIALGGGVVGDLAGFVAATLHRGIPFVQIPTSLLAQVDSSVGGKVAVDHPLGKNLIGAFYQPDRVFIDLSLLKTLSPREFRNGIAEVIKYAVILDAGLFKLLESSSPLVLARDNDILLKIVQRCCDLKRQIVEKDERELDLRRILNFGHTIGHALELLSNFRILHGEAVSIGMLAEARIAEWKGMMTHREVARLDRLLRQYGLPTAIPRRTDFGKLLLMTSRDKKSIDGDVRYTLPVAIGSAAAGVRLTAAQVRSLLQGGPS